MIKDKIQKHLALKSDDLKQAIINFHKTYQSELNSIAILELVYLSEGIVFWSVGYDGSWIDGLFSDDISDLVPSELHCELLDKFEDDGIKIFLDLLKDWVLNVWDSLDDEFKFMNTVFLEHDDLEYFWLSKRKWEKVDDKINDMHSYETNFGIKMD